VFKPQDSVAPGCFEHPSLEQPGFEEPGFEQSGFEQPSLEQPGFGRIFGWEPARMLSK
jgi:hypothetical protein